MNKLILTTKIVKLKTLQLFDILLTIYFSVQYTKL